MTEKTKPEPTENETVKAIARIDLTVNGITARSGRVVLLTKDGAKQLGDQIDTNEAAVSFALTENQTVIDLTN